MGELDPLRKLLSEAAYKCEGLESLLRAQGQTDQAQLLAQGVYSFTTGANSLSQIEKLVGIAQRSFTEDGPRLPTLLRELSQLTPTEPPPPPAGDFPRRGMFILDRHGTRLDLFNELATDDIQRTVPFRHPNGKRPRMSSFRPTQRILTNAFFLQEGGALTLPTMLDVYEYYLRLNPAMRGVRSIYESEIGSYGQGFVQQSAEVIYKLRYLGNYSDNEYAKVSGLRTFERKIQSVMEEYRELTGQNVTPADLEAIALRQTPLQTLTD